MIEKAGFFDENVFLYYEENILCKKVKDIGLDVLVNSDVQIVHNHSVSVDKSISKIGKFKVLGKSQRHYHKYYNKCNIFGMAFLYFTYYIALGVSYILSIFKKQ